MINKKLIKSILLFIVFNIFFAPISATLMIRFLPFENVKKGIVGMCVTSYSHSGLANLFASNDEIKNIISQNRYGVMVSSTNKNLIKVEHKFDKGITLYEVKSDTFHGKLLKIEDPLRIKVCKSKDIPKAGETTSALARRHSAVAAINAGGFTGSNWGGTGGMPSGVIIQNGEITFQSKPLKEYMDIVGFTKKGVLVVGRQKTSSLLSIGVSEAVCFGPALIVNGQPMIKRGDGGWGIAPRTAIGQTRDGEVLMLVIDGRQMSSAGAYLLDIQNIMLKYGAYNAANLDGGSSTTMYYKGRVVNNPCDIVGERSVPTIVMVTP